MPITNDVSAAVSIDISKCLNDPVVVIKNKKKKIKKKKKKANTRQ
jgi:hypothetical protein